MGETPGDYRQFAHGSVECQFDGSNVTKDLPADFEKTRFEIIVFHPDRPLTRDEAVERLRELLGVRPLAKGQASVLYGPFGLALNLRAREVRVRGVTVPLTLREFELLRLLLERRGEVLAPDEIVRSIWGYETFVSRNLVESAISRLRAKLARVDDAGTISTVRGVGYVVRDEAGVQVPG